MNGTELRSFSHFQTFIQNHINGPEKKSSNLLIFKFVFIHCKTVKVSQKYQNRM